MLNGIYKTSDKKTKLIEYSTGSERAQFQKEFLPGDTIPEYWKELADEYFDQDYLSTLDKVSKRFNVDFFDSINLIEFLLDLRKTSRLEKNWDQSDKFFKWVTIENDGSVKSNTQSFPSKRKYVEWVIAQDRLSDSLHEAWLYTMSQKNKNI